MSVEVEKALLNGVSKIVKEAYRTGFTDGLDAAINYVESLSAYRDPTPALLEILRELRRVTLHDPTQEDRNASAS